MKKLGFFGMLALMAITFTACPGPDDNPDLDVVVEDGFYVAGPATGAEALAVDYRMAVGVNEYLMQAEGKTWEEAKRPGMYEKYVALEANKGFYLLLKEAGVETRYSAALDTFSTNGENDQPTVVLNRGILVTGSSAPEMVVSESGLYHIVLDLNTNGDLANAQIIVAPVEWGTRGVNDDWGFNPMTGSAFNRTSMVWRDTFATTNAGTFKFAYGGGWKIQLDDAGLVKAQTNLGKDMVNGGDNINMPAGTDIVVTLTWTLKGGVIANSYAMNIAGNIIILDPSTFVVGFSGSAFDAPAPTWGDPTEGSTLAVYNAEKSSITDATTKAGVYVYEISNLKFNAAGEFKVRVNGAWIGVGGVTIAGATFTGTDNFIVGQEAVYDVEFSVAWDGAAGVTTVTFTEAAK